MKTYEVIATVTARGKLIIPAPLRKAGARLRLVVTWEETAGLRSRARPDRVASIRKLRGSLKNKLKMSVDEWNQHKREIW